MDTHGSPRRQHGWRQDLRPERDPKEERGAQLPAAGVPPGCGGVAPRPAGQDAGAHCSRPPPAPQKNKTTPCRPVLPSCTRVWISRTRCRRTALAPPLCRPCAAPVLPSCRPYAAPLHACSACMPRRSRAGQLLLLGLLLAHGRLWRHCWWAGTSVVCLGALPRPPPRCQAHRNHSASSLSRPAACTLRMFALLACLPHCQARPKLPGSTRGRHHSEPMQCSAALPRPILLCSHQECCCRCLLPAGHQQEHGGHCEESGFCAQGQQSGKGGPDDGPGAAVGGSRVGTLCRAAAPGSSACVVPAPEQSRGAQVALLFDRSVRREAVVAAGRGWPCQLFVSLTNGASQAPTCRN